MNCELQNCCRRKLQGKSTTSRAFMAQTISQFSIVGLINYLFIGRGRESVALSSRSSPIIHTFISQFSRYPRERLPSKISSQLQRDTINSHFIKIYCPVEERRAARNDRAAFGRCTLREKKRRKKKKLIKCSNPEKRVALQNVIGPVALLQPRVRGAGNCQRSVLCRGLDQEALGAILSPSPPFLSSPPPPPLSISFRRDSFRSLRTTSNVLAKPLISFRELARVTGIFQPWNKCSVEGVLSNDRR